MRPGLPIAVMLSAALASSAAQPPVPPPPPGGAYVRPAGSLARQIFRDQRAIWSSPAKLRTRDLYWLAPLAGASAYLFSSDTRNMRERFRTNPTAAHRAEILSHSTAVSLAAIPAYLGWYAWKHNDAYAAETAVLSARAAASSLLAAQLVAAVARREKPSESAAQGRFFRSSPFSSSLPSLHSSMAWAIAPVIAQRYPGWLTRLGVYSLAAATTVSRVSARQGFPSDVVLSSAAGFLIGRYVARAARPRASSAFLQPPPSSEPAPRDDAPFLHSASVTVPPDSWIYPALDRLAALGLVPSQIASLRPWTRDECRRQLLEAEDALRLRAAASPSSLAAAAQPLLDALRRELVELEPRRPAVILESLYLRGGALAGPVLNDSFHFGQTWINDLGRPFQRGWNANAGFSLRSGYGPFFAYYRGEFQHAPGREPYSLATRSLIAFVDDNPLQPPRALPEINRFRPVEAYAGVRLADFVFSAGKQSLYYGPTFDAPLSFSSNAEPTKNFRVSMAHPWRLPGLLSVLGSVRGEFVIGKLGGHAYTWRPWFNSQKLSFKLSDDLEMGFTRWSIFWGQGHPITVRSFLRNLTSFASTGTFAPYDATDPGDRKGAFDFRLRVPGLRDWLTLYTDSYSDDDSSPLAAPRRAAISPGIHLTRLPGIAGLDLRVETASTMPMSNDYGGAFTYYNNQYHSGNTNYGYILGSTAGRDGRAIQAWSTYWLSARTKIQGGYRQLKIGSRFLPGGGTQTDATLKTTFHLSPSWTASFFLQYERFLIPSLALQNPALGSAQRNVSGWFGLSWEPSLKLASQ